MILARIAKALKDQNWLAVAIEFVIVILGVVIGFQITSWNTERAVRSEEVRILQRMLSDSESLLSSRRELSDHLDRGWRETRDAVAAIYIDGGAVTEWQCQRIIGSHIYTQMADTVPTLEDLLSTGRLDLIRDETVRSAVTDYLITRETARNFTAALNNQIFRLANRYPDMVDMTLYRSDDPNDLMGLDRELSCDAEAMAASAAFRNDLTDNMARMMVLSNSAVGPTNEALERLADALADSLGRSRQGDAGATP